MSSPLLSSPLLSYWALEQSGGSRRQQLARPWGTALRAQSKETQGHYLATPREEDKHREEALCQSKCGVGARIQIAQPWQGCPRRERSSEAVGRRTQGGGAPAAGRAAAGEGKEAEKERKKERKQRQALLPASDGRRAVSKRNEKETRKKRERERMYSSQQQQQQQQQRRHHSFLLLARSCATAAAAVIARTHFLHSLFSLWPCVLAMMMIIISCCCCRRVRLDTTARLPKSRKWAQVRSDKTRITAARCSGERPGPSRARRWAQVGPRACMNRNRRRLWG